MLLHSLRHIHSHIRNKYPWATNPDLLNAWKEGKTGYPFIDANMRELKMSGWMSNRGRQVVASFLVRPLLLLLLTSTDVPC